MNTRRAFALAALALLAAPWASAQAGVRIGIGFGVPYYYPYYRPYYGPRVVVVEPAPAVVVAPAPCRPSRRKRCTSRRPPASFNP